MTSHVSVLSWDVLVYVQSNLHVSKRATRFQGETDSNLQCCQFAVYVYMVRIPFYFGQHLVFSRSETTD